jgi:hypothetical protein
MVSRETRVQLVVGTVATALLGITTWQLHPIDGPLFAAVILVYYGLIFGGTHLYLAWRGEDGSVPVNSRWRFLGVLGALLTLGAIGAFGPDGRLGGVTFNSYLAFLGVTILVGYWLLEARDGYLANRPL